MMKLHQFKAEHNLLTAVVHNGGGIYTAPSYARAVTFRRRCYQYLRLLRQQAPGKPTPFDDVEMALKKDSPVLVFNIRASLPEGTLTNLDGSPVPIEDISESLLPKPKNELDIGDLNDLSDYASEIGMFDDE